jgi:hypothetical protein
VVAVEEVPLNLLTVVLLHRLDKVTRAVMVVVIVLEV